MFFPLDIKSQVKYSMGTLPSVEADVNISVQQNAWIADEDSRKM